MKNSILSFESKREHYRADVTVVWSFDDRFSLALQVLSDKKGWKAYDLIKVAGGAKDLCTEDETCGSSFLLDQISKSIRLHNSPEVYLMNHYNCGAYGRNQMEPTEDEDRFFMNELRVAKKRVEDHLRLHDISVPVRNLLVDFRDIYEVD
ncbi:MAG: hypothetical protein AAB645_00390 [Patescibacteria group bacterium]